EVFDTDEDVQQLTKRLIAPLGLRLDTSWPFVDTRLPGGPRLHAAIPPATTRHTVLSLRKYTVTARSVSELVWPETPGDQPVTVGERVGKPLVPPGAGEWAPLERSRQQEWTSGPGMLSGPAADFLTACVRAGVPLVISGAPGSGKTTLLRAL